MTPMVSFSCTGCGKSWQARAVNVAALYFHQLLHGELTLLDLRPSAFTSEPGRLVWRPAAWITSWDPSFIGALRELGIPDAETRDPIEWERMLAARS